jgi:RimJ/RimL family protein N-acetyltransferase
MQVSIRPLQEQDAYTSVKWRNDPEVFKYTGNTYDHEILLETELEWIRKVIANNNSGKEYRCAILADNEYVGNIYLTDIENKSAHYHIFVGDRRYWGKGIAKHASIQILNYAFYNLGLEYVVLRVKKQNTSAYELYKKLGFIEVEEHDDWISMKILKS